MNMTFLTKHVLGQNFQDVAQEMTNFMELHNLIHSVASEGAASAALSDPCLEQNSTMSSVANSCFVPFFLNNPDRPLPYLADPSSQSSSSSSSHGPHELFIDFHGFLPHGLLTRLILNLGEKCENASINLSSSRLSEEAVEGGSWEMVTADTATFNFNLTNSVAYEVDLEPLTLCNSARVTLRWPEDHKRGHDVLSWFRDLVAVTMPMCGVQYHLGPNCPAKNCGKRRASTALAMGPSSLSVPSRLHVIDLNPSQPVVCAKERIDLHPSIAKWLPTAELNRGTKEPDSGSSSTSQHQFKCSTQHQSSQQSICSSRATGQQQPPSAPSPTPPPSKSEQKSNQRHPPPPQQPQQQQLLQQTPQHEQEQQPPNQQPSQRQQGLGSSFSEPEASTTKATPSRPSSRCSSGGRSATAVGPTPSSTASAASPAAQASAAAPATVSSNAASNASFSSGRFARKEASESVDEAAAAAVAASTSKATPPATKPAPGGTATPKKAAPASTDSSGSAVTTTTTRTTFGGAKLKDADPVFAAASSSKGLSCK